MKIILTDMCNYLQINNKCTPSDRQIYPWGTCTPVID